MKDTGDEKAASSEGVGKLLSTGEKIGLAASTSWINPAYWNRQFVTASHITNNVKAGSNVIELGKDSKNLYYVTGPKAVTLIIPPSNKKVQEGPIREAAVKRNVPLILYTERALDTLPIPPMSFDAALCMDMLNGAPQTAANGAVILLCDALKSGGRLLFLEHKSVGMPQMVRDLGMTVEYETEGGFDVGLAYKRVVGKTNRKKKAASSTKKKRSSTPAPATEAGFGGRARKLRKNSIATEPEKSR